MAFPITVLPFYPNVPNVPGVPPVPRLPGAVQSIIAAVTSDVLTALSMFAAPQWGIFDSTGNPVLVGDTCEAFDYRGESRASDFQIEGGGFASYNKVQLPYDARVTFNIGGSDVIRNAFLTACEVAKQSLDLYTISTREVFYPNANVVDYDYRRTAKNGVSLLTVEVRCQEIRIIQSATFTNTQNTSAQDPQDQGTVSTAKPNGAQQSSFNDTGDPSFGSSAVA